MISMNFVPDSSFERTGDNLKSRKAIINYNGESWERGHGVRGSRRVQTK